MRRAEREVSGKDALEALLKSYGVCRIGLVDNGKPYVVPVNFGYEWTDKWPVIYFHGAAVGRKMELLAQCPQVCVEWDGDHTLLTGQLGCDYSYCFSSLIGEGKAEILTDPTDKRHGLDVLMKQFAAGESFQYSERALIKTAVVRVTLYALTGKQRKN